MLHQPRFLISQGEDDMGTTQPIKDLEQLIALKNFYLEKEPNLRNYALICTGINTALRIQDLLSLKWGQVYCFEDGLYRTHLILRESKTGKEACIALNDSVKSSLALYQNSLKGITAQDYIFRGRTPDAPLSRSQAFRIIKHACSSLHLSERISCHSLRKTFGYQAWASGANPTILMLLFNHSSFTVTKRYLGIEQDDKDKVVLNLNL